MEFHVAVIAIAMALFGIGGPGCRLADASSENNMKEALRNLQSGLFAHKTILRALLPEPDPSVPRSGYDDFYSILRSLSELNEQERRISALLTISEHQSNAELMAVQTVFEKLLENACELMKVKLVKPVNCSYNELMKLKLKLEAYFLSAESKTALNNHDFGFEIDGINRHQWLNETVVCQLNDEGVNLLNTIYAKTGRRFSKSHCTTADEVM